MTHMFFVVSTLPVHHVRRWSFWCRLCHRWSCCDNAGMFRHPWTCVQSMRATCACDVKARCRHTSSSSHVHGVRVVHYALKFQCCGCLRFVNVRLSHGTLHCIRIRMMTRAHGAFVRRVRTSSTQATGRTSSAWYVHGVRVVHHALTFQCSCCSMSPYCFERARRRAALHSACKACA